VLQLDLFELNRPAAIEYGIVNRRAVCVKKQNLP
jgi:hypothetical protein